MPNAVLSHPLLGFMVDVEELYDLGCLLPKVVSLPAVHSNLYFSLSIVKHFEILKMTTQVFSL